MRATNVIIPTLQHSLLHHTNGHLHLPQATAGWMQATNVIIPTLQHSLLHHTTGHLHLPQATAGWMQATETGLFPHCNTPCYTTPRVICTYHKQLQAGCRPQRCDYSHNATLPATPHHRSSALTTNNCRLDAGHRIDYHPSPSVAPW